MASAVDAMEVVGLENTAAAMRAAEAMRLRLCSSDHVDAFLNLWERVFISDERLDLVFVGWIRCCW